MLHRGQRPLAGERDAHRDVQGHLLVGRPLGLDAVEVGLFRGARTEEQVERLGLFLGLREGIGRHGGLHLERIEVFKIHADADNLGFGDAGADREQQLEGQLPGTADRQAAPGKFQAVDRGFRGNPVESGRSLHVAESDRIAVHDHHVREIRLDQVLGQGLQALQADLPAHEQVLAAVGGLHDPVYKQIAAGFVLPNKNLYI